MIQLSVGSADGSRLDHGQQPLHRLRAGSRCRCALAGAVGGGVATRAVEAGGAGSGSCLLLFVLTQQLAQAASGVGWVVGLLGYGRG